MDGFTLPAVFRSNGAWQTSEVIGFLIACATVLSYGANVQGADSSDQASRSWSTDDVRSAPAANPSDSHPLCHIENVRFEPAPLTKGSPSVVLKFDVFNDSETRLTDFVMRVSFVEKRFSDDAESQPRILVGPVTFTTRDVVEPGYVLGYEMRFRNLSTECGCIPSVQLLSARSLTD